jgi:methionyl-tRNA formyltransferase
MKIAPKHFDIGPIIAQRSMVASPRLTSFLLLDKLADLSNQMVLFELLVFSLSFSRFLYN